MNKKMIRLTEGDLHSEESYNRAWENLWSQIDKNRMGINWDVYERYKGNPHAIKRWFDKWGIDVNEYLNEARNMNEKQIRLTENDLHRIVKESVNKIIREGFYDPDDDNELFDIGDGGKYRVSWEFKTQVSYHEFKTVSEGRKVVDSEEDAYKMVDALRHKYEGTYATELRIERLVKTLSDDRWDNVFDWGRGYVRCD